MTDTTLGIGFSLPTDSETCLKLEQEPWGKDVGETTDLQGITGIIAAVTGSRWPDMYCGGTKGIFNATVYAYPCNTAFRWQLKVSHGSVVSSRMQHAYREEVIQCSLQKEVTPDYPVMHAHTLAWIGNCYDSRGNTVGKPLAWYADGAVHVSRKVYGSLRFRYMVRRTEYKIKVSRRTGAFENKYEVVAYAVWDGGVTWIDVDPPAGFEAFDGDCGNGFYTDDDGNQTITQDICGPEYSKLPKAVEADRSIIVWYCDQEIMSDETIERVEDEKSKDDCDD